MRATVTGSELSWRSAPGSTKTEWLMGESRSAVSDSLSDARVLCNPTDCSPPGSSVRGIFQARTLEWGAMLASRGFSRPRDRTPVFCPGRRVLHQQNHQGSRLASKGA